MTYHLKPYCALMVIKWLITQVSQEDRKRDDGNAEEVFEV